MALVFIAIYSGTSDLLNVNLFQKAATVFVLASFGLTAAIGCDQDQSSENHVIDVYSIDYEKSDENLQISVNSVMFRPAYSATEEDSAGRAERGSSGGNRLRIEGQITNTGSTLVRLYRSYTKLDVQTPPSVVFATLDDNSSQRVSALVDGAEYMHEDEGEYYLLEPGVEYPLLIFLRDPLYERSESEELDLAFERIEPEESAVFSASFESIELGEPTEEQFDPFNVGW